MKDPNLNVASLAQFMNMSRSTLYRKIKEISALSPNELINISRLKKAAFLLKATNKKIFEISEEVGYRSQTSFGRNFQKHFKMSPSSFLEDMLSNTQMLKSDYRDSILALKGHRLGLHKKYIEQIPFSDFKALEKLFLKTLSTKFFFLL